MTREAAFPRRRGAPIVAAALAVALAWPAPAMAQEEGSEPDAGQEGPVRIVPAEREQTPERPAPRRQTETARPAPTVTLERGPVAAAGTPLWIVDPETNRLIACVYERTAAAPRINCVSRPLP